MILPEVDPDFTRGAPRSGLGAYLSGFRQNGQKINRRDAKDAEQQELIPLLQRPMPDESYAGLRTRYLCVLCVSAVSSSRLVPARPVWAYADQKYDCELQEATRKGFRYPADALIITSDCHVSQIGRTQVMTKGIRRRDRPSVDATTVNFISRHPGQAADVTSTLPERTFYIVLFSSVVVVSLLDWFAAAWFLYLCYSVYISVILFRTLCVGISLFGPPEIVIAGWELAAARTQEWPRYTVLVPLYREPEVAAKTVSYLDRLDYPRGRLEVLLLLEEDDDLTRTALSRIRLPAYFRVINVPDSDPRTKPKACNWGLRDASGEYLVIYDAEDRPDSDQLKKAALAFERMPERVICLQAKLSYYNPDQNLLTRWFTMEYAAWFDLYLPGLYRLKFPIPLGGTSNHFRRRVLEDIGGWDPFNVAEDCDLGIRLHRLGYRTAMLDTTTWEEANSQVRNWVRQRSRWVKGYLQTHLVHTRRPWRALRELGLLGTLSFLLSVGGHSLVLLVNPIFWLGGGAFLFQVDWAGLARRGIVESFVSGDIFPVMAGNAAGRVAQGVAAVLVAANFLFILFNVMGCIRRRLGLAYLVLALASPAYWVLISIAAWKGLLQLIRRPHYWEKTDHGLFPEPEAAAIPGATGAPAGGGPAD
jgi:cellulose synthase/poly-beta-1,6-N-acetylglucosamine synthase-like glycosyltransferase